MTPAGPTDPDAWLEEWPSRLTAMVDLLCFPGAGAGASVFLPWASRLPAFAALLACRLPGRESRIDEPPVHSLADAADAVVGAYAARRPAGRPLVLFGHSMGGVLAFEAACRLAAAGRAPACVVISASTPPGEPRGRGEMDLEALKDLLIAYDPENAAIVSNAELFASLAPALRSDMALPRGHRIAPARALPGMQAWLFSGAADRIVPRDSVARWACHFAGPVSQAELPGGHHFPFRDSRDAVLERLARILRGAVVPRTLA